MLVDLSAETLKEEQRDPQKVADAIVERAREESERILEEARKEAEEIKKRATVEAEEKMKKAEEEIRFLLEKAKKEGYEKGFQDAREAVELVKEIAERYEKYMKDLRESALPVLLSVYKEVASRALVDGLMRHEDLIEKVIEKVLDRLSSSRNVIFRVSLPDYERHGKKIADLLSFIPDLTVRPDSSLKPGEILAETEFGMVDASPWRVVEEFKEVVEGLIDGISDIGRDEIEDSAH